jgi:hypothetical protein
VIVGAGVGAAFGILIPALHRTAQAKFGKQNVHLTGGPGDAGLGVVGRF